jgi:hypothetical protein
VEYRKTYTGFYKLRLPSSGHYDYYFALLESEKENKAIKFVDVFNKLSAETGRIEASFSSKIVATIDADRPVIDNVVLGNLNLALPKYYEKQRPEKCLRVYARLCNSFSSLLQVEEYPEIKARFVKHFPQFSFSDTKILDFVLWQYRP